MRRFRTPLGPRFQLIPFSLGHWLEAHDIPADSVQLTIRTSDPDVALRMEAALRKDYEDLTVSASVLLAAGMTPPAPLDLSHFKMYDIQCALVRLSADEPLTPVVT